MSEIEHAVPDEAVQAANAALAEERRLPASSMRAAILAALPFLPGALTSPRTDQPKETT